MTQVWKFSLENKESQEFEMPLSYEILTLQLQNDIPVIWVKVEADNNWPKRRVVIETFMTGNEWYFTNCPRHYIGTYQLDGLVYHVFNKIV